MPMNIYLTEATEKPKGASVAEVSSAIKKLMQTCRLTKFQSKEQCSKFYSAFFLSTLEEDVHENLTIKDWFDVYNALFSDSKFFDNLRMYLVLYAPFSYADLFSPLYMQCLSEIEQASDKQKTVVTAAAKSLFDFLEMKFNQILSLMSYTSMTPESCKFINTITQTTRERSFELYHMVQSALDQSVDPNDIQPLIPEQVPMQEDVIELIQLLESSDAWIQDYIDRYSGEMSEAVVKNAVMKAKEMKLKAEKATKAFDEFIMKKFRAMTLKRRNAKHSEMVGESLRITREIKRLLKSGALGILSPTLGIMHWIVTLFIDKKTDVKDRKVLINEIEDELEIVDEKIAMAERNGDDKAKIELIRFKQKLQREYESIRKVRYDAMRKKTMG